MSAINVHQTGKGGEPQPVPFEAASTRNSREQCELVTLDADFLELTPTREGHLLACSAQGQAFEAILRGGPPPDLERGMRLRLTGICEFSTTRPLVIPRNATGFSINLRGPEDIAVLSRPPWWGTGRARWVLGALALLALAVGAWAVSLQFIVRSQSSVIRHQARQQAVLEERQRIARDLHDTLEQELVGVTMLLDSTAMKLNGGQGEGQGQPHIPTQANEQLGLARRLLRRVREESRTTIMELRSVTLEQRGLPAALDELLRPLAEAGGAGFTVQVTGTPVRLAGTLETHLLRLAQEAVSNAARHAGALQISLLLAYSTEQVTLEVRDDGCGFDPQAAPPTGHFGLTGMRERVAKIIGQLRIASNPGAGTSVTITAPVVPASEHLATLSP